MGLFHCCHGCLTCGGTTVAGGSIWGVVGGGSIGVAGGTGVG